MKFTEPRVNVIESDEGWSLEIIPGRTGMIYRDRKKFIKIDSEMLGPISQYDMVIYADSIREWSDGNVRISITNNESQKILKNIIMALESKGYKADVCFPSGNKGASPYN